MKIAQLPDPDQIAELLDGPEHTPVVMLNLLRFKQHADNDSDESGRASYERYGEKMRKIVEAAGGRFLWAGRADSQVIGRSDVAFEVVALVEYPSRAAFLKVASSDEVREVGVHRAAGLEGQWLIACTEAPLGAGETERE